MKVVGIIAECNPFHKGHAYLLRQARLETSADYVVVALSADYVQRGAPAILGWESRVQTILENGADLVVSLPLYVSCSGADYFARGGIALLSSLGVVTDLAFGSETGDLDALQRAGALIAGEPAAFRSALHKGLREGLAFPAARELAASATGADLIPASSNDLLGAEYCKALAMSGSSITPHAVRRIPGETASSIRSKLLSGGTGRREDNPGSSGAESTLYREKSNTASDSVFLCRDDFSDLLLGALLPHTFEERTKEEKERSRAPSLDSFVDVSPDLANKIRRELPCYDSFTGFCTQLKSRNLTYTRISRALLHILLGMTGEKMHMLDTQYGLCGWIRPLGFRKDAAPLLSMISRKCSVPFLDKLSRASCMLQSGIFSILTDEFRAELLYDITSHRKVAAGGAGGTASCSQPVRKAMEKKIVVL